jgi:prepilin-type N-terminal cleavage/methylation domain-containing protein
MFSVWGKGAFFKVVMWWNVMKPTANRKRCSYHSRFRFLAVVMRPSFTLVEILVALAIIGVLSGMVMVALAGAQRDADIAKTKLTITKISNILLTKYREQSLAPAKIDIPQIYVGQRLRMSNQQPYFPVSGRELSRTKLIAIRHLLRWEMPDRPSDITADSAIPLRIEVELPNGSYISPTVNLSVPVENSIIFQNLKPGWDVYDPVNLSFPDAKLLYQIIATSTNEESSGLEDFRPSEIGDPDGDGNPEFIDAWGMPIRFIRWPAGAWKWSLVAKQSRDAEVYSWIPASSAVPASGPWLDRNPGVSGGDSMDPTRCDWRYSDDDRNHNNVSVDPLDPLANETKLNNPFDLIPLVVSAGSDRDYGIVFSGEDVGTLGPFYGNMPIPSGFTSNHHPNYRYPDPYFSFSVNNAYTSRPAQLGDPVSDAYKDNVTSFDPRD